MYELFIILVYGLRIYGVFHFADASQGQKDRMILMVMLLFSWQSAHFLSSFYRAIMIVSRSLIEEEK